MKILHTADIHLGYETHGRLDPATGLNSRLLDFKRSFDFIVEKALEEKVDVFLFCGDAYRTADPTPTQQKLFAESLQPLLEAGIPVLMITGNHDIPVSFGKASSLDIFRFVRGNTYIYRVPTVATIPTASGPLQFIALPWPVKSLLLSNKKYHKMSPSAIIQLIVERYVQFIEQALQSFDPFLPTLLAGHFTVQGAQLSGSERSSLIAHEPVFSVGQLAQPGIDYVALGHIHQFQDLNPEGDIPVVYPSSIERISFKEAHQPKGFVLVDIASTGARKNTSYTFIETPARPFVAIEVDLRNTAEPTEHLLRAIAQHPIQDAVVRIRYQIEDEKAQTIDFSRIRQALAEAHVIAGIERTIHPTVREQRTIVTRELPLQEALERYITQHQELHALKEDLITAAKELLKESGEGK